MKVVKFGGSSMADAGQYRKVRDILLADPERKVVIVSAAGKRFSGDHKLTDLLYLCYSHVKYGVDCSGIFQMIESRYLDIQKDLNLDLDLAPELAELKKRVAAKEVTREELVSRGEYFSAKLMASYLGFRFIDAADWVSFNLDGTVNQEVTYAALRERMTPGIAGCSDTEQFPVRHERYIQLDWSRRMIYIHRSCIFQPSGSFQT